jgi:hypothetical protein
MVAVFGSPIEYVGQPSERSGALLMLKSLPKPEVLYDGRRIAIDLFPSFAAPNTFCPLVQQMLLNVRYAAPELTEILFVLNHASPDAPR